MKPPCPGGATVMIGGTLGAAVGKIGGTDVVTGTAAPASVTGILD